MYKKWQFQIDAASEVNSPITKISQSFTCVCMEYLSNILSVYNCIGSTIRDARIDYNLSLDPFK